MTSPVSSRGIRELVASYEESTTGPDSGRLTNTKRMARWSRRLAAHLLEVAAEIERLMERAEAQGAEIARLTTENAKLRRGR